MCSSLSSLHARWQRCCVSHQETWWQGVTMILFPRCGDSEGDNRQCCSRWCLFSQHPGPVLELTPSCLQSVRQYLTLQMNDYKGKYDYWQTRENFRQQILPIAQSAPGLCGGCNCGFMLYPTKITEESHSSMWTPTQFIAAPLLPLHNRRYVPDILACQCGSNSRKFKHNKNVKTLSYIFMILR